MKPARGASTALRTWLACGELDRLLARAEPSWSPAENFYYPLSCEPLSPRNIAGEWRQALARPGAAAMTSLYVHIPFCPAKCRYCVYYSKGGAPRSEVAAYLSRLDAEASFYAPVFAKTRFDAWSIGGGTPTVLDPADLDRLLLRLQASFLPKEAASLEFETSPATITAEKADVFRGHGFNRVSFGVQSFSKPVLSAVDRGYQSPEHVQLCMAVLRDRGFRINMDLLYGLPGGGLAETRASAGQAMKLGPDSIVIYPLSAGTPALPASRGKGTQVPFSCLAQELSEFADRMDYAVESDWFSVRLHNRRLLRPPQAPAAYDDLYPGRLAMMCLGPTSRGHIHDRLAYRHDSYAPGTVFDPAAPVSSGWRLGPGDEMRMHLTRSLSRTGRIDHAEFERLFGESLRKRFGPDLAALERLGVLSVKHGSHVRSRAKTSRHAPELFLLGERIRGKLLERVHLLGAADLVNAGLKLLLAGRREQAFAEFNKAAGLDPRGMAGAVWKAVRSEPDLASLWNSVEVHSAAGRLELGSLKDAVERVRALLSQGIRLYAGGRRSRAKELFLTAARLDPGGPGPRLLAASQGRGSLQALADAAGAPGFLADLSPLLTALAKLRLINREGVRLFNAGEPAAARKLFEAGLKLDPDDRNCLMSLGALACRQGRPAEALALYDRLAKAGLKKDSLADWAGARCLALERLGRVAEARKQVSAVLADPSLPRARRKELSDYLSRLSAGKAA
ncbi:MAG: radical SAM protein [Elusimicrobia bacterium]|nr:radical SAM protein [Elusimicrobiota bacterium]